MAKRQKDYVVNIDMKWSQDIKVKAASEAEARKKAFEKFQNKRLPRKDFNISADEI